MPSPETVAECVLRQPVMVQKVRRLPGLMPTPPQVSVPETVSVLTTLREQFATELNMLRDEACQLGLAAASKKAEADLHAIREEQARHWQESAKDLRLDSLQERSQLIALISAIQVRHDQLVSDLEPVVTRLALLVTSRFLGHYPGDRCLVADLARQAIETHRLEQPFQISLAVSDHACLLAHESGIGIRPFLNIDPALSPGSCRIDFGHGQLDASLKTQWAALEEKLLQAEQGGRHVGSV